MVLLALFAALVCLVLGLVFASGPWLIASLACSALAALVLWRQRSQGKPRARTVPAGKDGATRTVPGAPKQTSLATGTAFGAKTAQRRPKPRAESRPDEPQVWVVDGKPDYHLSDCARIAGADSEAIPLPQARADGFTECLGCAPVPGSATPVWVIDGRPDYHREDCSRLSRGTAEQVRLGQAFDDGFSPCDQCRPEGSPADGVPPEVDASTPSEPSEPPDATPADQVWVVDGRPRYHLETCMIIHGQDAEPIPLAQATEDGFMPCSMCEPFVSRV